MEKQVMIPNSISKLSNEQLIRLRSLLDNDGFMNLIDFLKNQIEEMKEQAIKFVPMGNGSTDSFEMGLRKGEYNAHITIGALPKFAEAELKRRAMKEKAE